MSDLTQSLLVLDASGPQKPQNVFGSLGHRVFHPVVMSEVLQPQLDAPSILVPCRDRYRSLGDQQGSQTGHRERETAGGVRQGETEDRDRVEQDSTAADGSSEEQEVPSFCHCAAVQWTEDRRGDRGQDRTVGGREPKDQQDT